VAGTVADVRHEDDGDFHINIDLDPQYAGLINDRNGEHGALVVELVPADEPGCTVGQPPRPASGTYDYGSCTGADETAPTTGAHVAITGPYVLDRGARMDGGPPADAKGPNLPTAFTYDGVGVVNRVDAAKRVAFCPVRGYGAVASARPELGFRTADPVSPDPAGFVVTDPWGVVVSNAAAKSEPDPETTRGLLIDTGIAVEVRSRFDGRWCAGFEVADRIEADSCEVAYRLRRTTDGAILPVLFGDDDDIMASAGPRNGAG
jgi:hypothetical protein